MRKLKKSTASWNKVLPMSPEKSIIAIMILFVTLSSLPSQDIFTQSAGPGAQEIPGLIPIATFDEGRSYRTVVGSYPILSLKGSWREMGRQYGALLSKELKEFYAAINADLQARGLGQEHIEGVQATFQTYMPEMKQLIEGMSETSGLSFEEHIMLDASFYILPDLVIEAAQAMASCSGIAV
ncbi:MAG TPA: hypothetical protein PLM50_09890, partial [Rectinema sp.]|nr:hypothetical protein [Rectinema sp.]